MGKKLPEILYTKDDINKAFSMGLETAIVILEKSVGLSIPGRRLLIESLKKRVEQDKVKALEMKRPLITSSAVQS